jgi:hypothetical protein
MPDAAKTQAANPTGQAPVWQIAACGQPRPDASGGVLIRAMNHAGHAIDIHFPRSLWLWISQSPISSQPSSSSGSEIPPVIKGRRDRHPDAPATPSQEAVP